MELLSSSLYLWEIEIELTLYHTIHPPETFEGYRVDFYSIVIHHWNHLLKPILFLHWKHRLNWGHYSLPLYAIGLRDVCSVVDLVRQSVILNQAADLTSSQTWSVSQTFLVSQTNLTLFQLGEYWFSFYWEGGHVSDHLTFIFS